MNNNEIDATISKMRGECRHEQAKDVGTFTVHKRCPCGASALEPFFLYETHPVPNYTSDPAAWTPKLFKEIEDKGLDIHMIKYLMDATQPPDVDEWRTWSSDEVAYFAMSQPIDIRATALARAIKESE